MTRQRLQLLEASRARTRRPRVSPEIFCEALPTVVRNLRPELATYLLQRIESLRGGFRHNVALLGPSGSGKTLLLETAVNSSATHLAVIHCHLQRDSLREFLRRFAIAVLRAAIGPLAAQSYDTLLDQARAMAPKTVEAVRQLERYESGHLSAEAFAHTLDLVPVLHQELQHPCVVILDEFLFLEDLQLAHAFHELGKRVMTWPFALFLLTSSSPYRARVILRERLHLLFGQFEVLSLAPVDSNAAMAWVREQYPSVSRLPGVAGFLIQWLGGSPWYLGLILKRIHELAQMSRARRTESAIWLQAAWDLLGHPDGVLYHWCLSRVERVANQRTGVVARDALLAIAQGARTSQVIAEKLETGRNLSEALQVLVEHDLVERKGTCWVMPDPILSLWLTGVFGPRERHGVLDRFTAQRYFEQVLADYWSMWRTTADSSLAERIEALLGQFHNETVSLENKTGRLPAFTSIRVQQSSQAGVTYVVADGENRGWCCVVHEVRLDEATVASFEEFCDAQSPKPVRKVVIARQPIDLNAKLLAKTSNMWVWEPHDVNLLFLLYGQPPLGGG